MQLGVSVQQRVGDVHRVLAVGERRVPEGLGPAPVHMNMEGSRRRSSPLSPVRAGLPRPAARAGV